MSHDPSTPNLLADLESRQDELLRLLGELEERTKQALAALTAPAKPIAPPIATTTTIDAPSIAPAAPIAHVESEPSPRAAHDAAPIVAAEKPAKVPGRSRSRKAA